jgi:signal transduction histidine kinase
MRPFARLRYQLIVSHLAAIGFTLVAMVGAVVFIANSWFASQQSTPSEPNQDARVVASAIGGLVLHQATSQELNTVLRALVNGDLHFMVGPNTYFVPQASRFHPPSTALENVAYAAVVGPDGKVIASSAPDGAAFAPPERQEWNALAAAALAGEHNPAQPTPAQPGSGTPTLGAYPVDDENGRPKAAVVVAMRASSPHPADGPFWSPLAVFGAASVAVLAGASVFALISASIVGYLLSRGLVARLERLGQAAEELAAGDLTRRVPEGPTDEVGQLTRRFNAMATRLATTVGELESAKCRTEAALAAKRELVANVSHELRTPLSLIRGHVESLGMSGSDVEPERRGEYLEVVQRETENLSRLIDDLFALSTAEAGALAVNLEAIPIADVVEEVASGLRSIARRERGITIVTECASDLPSARADRRRVVQVLGNLVRNALRHTPEGGLIAVRAEQQSEWIRLVVEDTGEGIAPERLPHVFERFYRGDDARDRASGGVGLGLAIVRELVEAMGGDVSVESVLGQGSRFSFRLPGVQEIPV